MSNPTELKAEIKRLMVENLMLQYGPEAIAVARTEQPDVIVLDIGLPPDVSVAWDGIRVMQWIKRLENGSAPPVIIITASMSGELRRNALAYGAVAFFQKPVDNDKLISAIADALEKKSTHATVHGKAAAFSIY